MPTGWLLPRCIAFAAAVALAGCGDEDLGAGCPGSVPAPPDVSGMWTVSEPEIVTSTCSTSINDDIVALIVGPTGSCEYDLDQEMNNISGSECHDQSLFGCVDGEGVIRAPIDLLSTVSGCTLMSTTQLTANAGSSDSTATYVMTITFSGDGSSCGVLTDCKATVSTAWRR